MRYRAPDPGFGPNRILIPDVMCEREDVLRIRIELHGVERENHCIMFNNYSKQGSNAPIQVKQNNKVYLWVESNNLASFNFVSPLFMDIYCAYDNFPPTLF